METLNGFSKAIYWPTKKITEHAKKYSPSFSFSDSAWQTDFDEMAKKTVLSELLRKWGVMSVEMETAFNADNADAADQQIVSDQPAIPAEGEVDELDRAE
jgi:recombination protein RecT